MPEISVIVPVYKVEEYLDECITSILNQSFKDFELILVDDGSPDKCGQICDEYAVKDSRIKVVHQENRGLSAARNIGLDMMTGDYIAFIDSDDVVERCFLQILYDAIIKYDAELSCCKMKTFESECSFDQAKMTGGFFSMSGREAALLQYRNDTQELIRASACGKLYAKHLFENSRFPEGRIHEDQAIVPIVLSRAKKVVACPLMLYGYRVRQESIMHSHFSFKRYDDIVAINECIEYFEKKGDSKLVSAAESRKKVLIAYYSILARKSGILEELPDSYKISRIKAIRDIRDSMPYDMYEHVVAPFYPGLVFIESHARKLRKVLGLKVKE